VRQSHSKAARVVVFILLLLLGTSPAQAATKDKASAKPSSQSCPALKQLRVTKPVTPALAKLARSQQGRTYLRLRREVICTFNRDKPGAHIVYLGVGKRHRLPAPKTLNKSIRLFRGWLAPPPPVVGLASAGSGGSPLPAAGASSAGSNGLPAIAQCESHNDPTAVSPDGKYFGKYQFSQSTWESVGGTGNPAQAPEGVQDALAVELHRQRGNAPWPNCG
jgi:hypothetical protein